MQYFTNYSSYVNNDWLKFTWHMPTYIIYNSVQNHITLVLYATYTRGKTSTGPVDVSAGYHSVAHVCECVYLHVH